MSALVYLNPHLRQALSNEHGVTISGFDETSFVIIFDGIPSAVREARKIINDKISKAIVTNVQCTFSQSLLLIVRKQLEAEQCKVYFSSELNISDNTNNLTVTVCSFDERHHCVAVKLLNRKEPIVDEVIIPPSTISNDGFTQQLKQLEDNFCVFIKEQKNARRQYVQ